MNECYFIKDNVYKYWSCGLKYYKNVFEILIDLKVFVVIYINKLIVIFLGYLFLYVYINK